MNNRYKALGLVGLLGLLPIFTIAQRQIVKLSLQEAVDYAMEHNYNVLKSEKDVEAAKQKVKEQMAYGFPQVNASVVYKDNIARPTNILPGEFLGKPGQDVEIQFGTRYTANVGGSMQQLIFSGEYLVGLKAAKKFFERTNVDFFKNKVAIKKQVAEAYYNVLATESSLKVIDSILQTTQKLYDEIKQVYEAGLAEDIDVDQLDLLVENLKASKTFFNNQLGITQAFLKFYLGMESSDNLVLTDDLNILINHQKNSPLLTEKFDYRNNPDYASMFKQKEISVLQIKLAKAAYLPSLMANLNLNTNAQRDAWNFFNTGEKWFFSGFWGATLKIPILSGGQRNAKLKQAQIAFDQITLAEKQLATTLQLQYQTARNNYINSLQVLINKQKNRNVADKIYNKTREKYLHGMAASLDILNTHNQYLNAERDYIKASVDYLKAAEALKAILAKIQNM